MPSYWIQSLRIIPDAPTTAGEQTKVLVKHAQIVETPLPFYLTYAYIHYASKSFGVIGRV